MWSSRRGHRPYGRHNEQAARYRSSLQSCPDPVALGFAASLARPGGNITGLANLFEELTPKQLQILKETMPKAQRIAILTDVNMAPDIQLATEAAARALGIMTRVFQIREVTDLDSAIGSAKIERADGVHVLSQASPADDQRVQLVCAGRRTDVIRPQLRGHVASGGELCRPRTEGSKTGRLAD